MGYKNNIKKVRQYGQECVNLLNLLSFGFMFIFKKVTVEITFTCSDAKQKKNIFVWSILWRTLNSADNINEKCCAVITIGLIII